MKPATSYYSGCSAEESVARAYERNGFDILHRRWKSAEGEVDVIASHGDKFYFIEVKKAKGFASAAERILNQQKLRIRNAAQDFLARHAADRDVNCRFDAALVNNLGQIQVIPNAF